MNGANELWCRVRKSKHKVLDASKDIHAKNIDSNLWKAIAKMSPMLLNIRRWNIGNGSQGRI